MSNYTPIFPYKGSQMILTSDRIIVHTEDDAIFLFGKKAIGLSSVGRVNIDTNEGVTVNAPEIELGLLAKELGESVTKADTTIRLLGRVLTDLSKLSSALKDIGTEGSNPAIVAKSTVLESTCNSVKGDLKYIKSKITYTR